VLADQLSASSFSISKYWAHWINIITIIIILTTDKLGYFAQPCPIIADYIFLGHTKASVVSFWGGVGGREMKHGICHI